MLKSSVAQPTTRQGWGAPDRRAVGIPKDPASLLGRLAQIHSILFGALRVSARVESAPARRQREAAARWLEDGGDLGS